MVISSNALAAILLKEFPAFLPLFYKNPNASLTVIWNSEPVLSPAFGSESVNRSLIRFLFLFDHRPHR
jgi:hypothetical protein